MSHGVPRTHESRTDDSHTDHLRLLARAGRMAVLVGLASLLFSGSAMAASSSVGLGSAAGFSVLAGSTVTNTGPTTMFGSLGLSPGSSVTGPPVLLGQPHVAAR